MTCLINAHGPDHGLSVYLSGDEVMIAQWGEASEPDENGSFSPHIQRATVTVAELLEPGAVHLDFTPDPLIVDAFSGGRDDVDEWAAGRGDLADQIIRAATGWLAYWGSGSDDTEHVDDSDRPCDWFGSYWGAAQPPILSRLGCPVCHEPPLAGDPGRAPAWPV